MCKRVSRAWVVLCVGMVVSSFSDATFDNLVRSKKYKEALEYADEKIAPASRTADVWVKIAEVNEQLGLTEKALASYMVSWRMNPTDYASLLGAARIYNKLKQYDQATGMAKKALEQNFTGEASWEYARACIALKQPAEAKEALEKVMETDTANEVANRELGIIYYNDKEYAKAIPLLKKAYTKNPAGDVAFQIGKAYLEVKDHQSAIQYLKNAVEKKPSLYAAGLLLARCCFEVDNYGAAAAEYKRISGKASFVAADHFKKAVSLEKTNDGAAAITAYCSAVSEYGSSKDKEALLARHKVGKDHLAKKNYLSAITQFKFIADADAGGALIGNIYFLLADAYTGAENITKAIESLEKAISLDKTNIEAYARLADLYTKNKMGDKARKTYETMMSLRPDDPNVYLVLGQYNLKAKDYTKALDLFVKSNTLKKSASAAEGIALCAAALGQWDKARDAAESAVSKDGTLMESRNILYQALMKINGYKEAKVHLQVLVKNRSYDLKLWQDLATCCQKTGDTPGLAAADKKVAELDKKNVESRMRLARYSLSRDDQALAYKLFGELSVLTPGDASVFKNLYDIALAKKETNSAISFLRKYLALNPDDAECQRGLGDMLYVKKDLDGALAAYRKAIKIDPGIKGFYKRYAEIVIAKGQQAEVVKALTGVVSSGEADFGTYTTLGMIYQKNGSFTKAKEMYQKALMIEPQNTDALVALGSCQAKLDDVNGAVITYEQAVMMNPKAVEEYKMLGDLYTRQKKTDQAVKAYAKYLEGNLTDQVIAKKVGDYLYSEKDYKPAAKYLRLVKGEEAQSFYHQMKLAESYYRSEQYEEALKVFEELMKRNPKVSSRKTILEMMGDSYEKTKAPDKAVLMYDEYMKLGARDADIAYKRAFLREKTQPAVATNIYQQNVSTYPQDYRNFLQLGLIYSRSKATLAKSAPMLEKAAAGAGKIPSVWLEIAKVYGKMGKSDQELRAYKKFVESDPQNVDVNIRIGTILLEKGSVSEGMIYLETANTLSSDNVELMRALAEGYTRTERLQEAIDLLGKVKQLKPDDVETRKQLFQLYSKTGQGKIAMKEIEELIELKHDNSYMLLYARVLMMDGEVKKAENAIEDIMATDPENIDALMLRASIECSRKKYADALETYKEISYIDTDYAPALCQRAEVYMLQSKPQWAQRFYERALRADPKHGMAEFGMAQLAKLRKDNSGYRAHLSKAKQLDPTNPKILAEAKKAGL